MPHDVFLSHSSKDRGIADAICRSLEREGIRVWIAPRDVVPGADWPASIIEAINNARLFVLVFTRNSNTSPQIRREVERAGNKGMPIVTVRIEDIRPTPALEYFISSQHWLDAYPQPLGPHLTKLAAAARTLLRPPPRSPRDTAEPKSAAKLATSTVAADRPPASTGRTPRHLWLVAASLGLAVLAGLGTLTFMPFKKVESLHDSQSLPSLPSTPIATSLLPPRSVAFGGSRLCAPEAAWRISQPAGIGEITGSAQAIGSTKLQVANQIIDLADISPLQGNSVKRLQEWIDDLGKSVRCRPVAGTHKHCCDLGPTHLDVSTHILNEAWASPAPD